MFRHAALAVFAGKNSAKTAGTIGKAKNTAQCGPLLGTRYCRCNLNSIDKFYKQLQLFFFYGPVAQLGDACEQLSQARANRAAAF